MKMHIIPSYLLNPTHPVTVCVIGCGGTGSQVLVSLARINHTLQALGHPGLHVVTFDPDTVSQTNVGRQLFSQSDIGINKAVLLTTRVNTFYGTAWEAIPERFDKKNGRKCNITITCVDNLKSRIEVGRLLAKCGKSRYHDPYAKVYYWMDFGNARHTGQVVLGTLTRIKQPESALFETISRLPVFTEKFNVKTIKEEDSGPSCSHADALSKQSLFINSTLAQLGCDMLLEMLTEGMIGYSGFYLNLKTKCTNPMPLEGQQELSKTA